MKRILIVLILFFSYTTCSQTAEEYFYKGNKKYNKGDINGAIEDFTKAIELDPDDADAYNSRGVLKYATGISDGCSDLMMAKELGHNVHPDAMKAICH